MAGRFNAKDVLPVLEDHIAENEIFRQNMVSISVRVAVVSNEVSYAISYPENGETAFAVRPSIETALTFAETKQVRR